MVLAGGRATRMQGNKAGAVLGGRTLLDRAIALVRAAGLEPRICVREGTVLPTSAELLADAVWREPAAGETAGDAHPLAGLAHAAATANEPIVALPVDLPLLPSEVLRGLATHPAAASVIGVNGRPAALVARVDASCVAALKAAAAEGAPALRSLVDLGAQVVEFAELAPTAEVGRSLTNVNGPADLAAVERLLRAT